MIAVLVVVAVIALLIVLACCKVSGDCAELEERQNEQD